MAQIEWDLKNTVLTQWLLGYLLKILTYVLVVGHRDDTSAANRFILMWGLWDVIIYKKYAR